MAKGGFRGMPGGMNQAAMMKQAQKMQQEMLRMQAEQEAKKTAEWRRFAERLELISDRCAGMEWWQLDEVIIAIDELLAKWAAA